MADRFFRVPRVRNAVRRFGGAAYVTMILAMPIGSLAAVAILWPWTWVIGESAVLWGAVVGWIAAAAFTFLAVLNGVEELPRVLNLLPIVGILNFIAALATQFLVDGATWLI